MGRLKLILVYMTIFDGKDDHNALAESGRMISSGSFVMKVSNDCRVSWKRLQYLDAGENLSLFPRPLSQRE